ncbi:MAG: hypothetical protein AAF378_14455 [Cyanobacteria bacterium P01_A01_bin.84]
MNLANFILYFAESQPEQNSSIDWGMWGVIATIVVGVVIPIILYVIQTRRKSIKFLKVSTAPLVKIDDRFVQDLEVIYQGKKVEDVTSIVLKIYNSGNQAIAKSDFEDSIVIMFNENTEIIKAEILKTIPNKIKPSILVEKNIIEIKPLLINPKDIIEISAIVSSFDGNIEIGGRIKDIKEISLEEDYLEDNLLSKIFNVITIISLAGFNFSGLVILAYDTLNNSKSTHLYEGVILVFLALFCVSIFSSAVLQEIRKR